MTLYFEGLIHLGNIPISLKSLIFNTKYDQDKKENESIEYFRKNCIGYGVTHTLPESDDNDVHILLRINKERFKHLFELDWIR